MPSWYLDMTLVQRYWDEDRFYHHTAPITMIYAIREGLRLVHEEGLQARWDRHMLNHRALKAGHHWRWAWNTPRWRAINCRSSTR